MTTMAPPPAPGSTPEPLREIKRQRRERLAKPDENLANDTVESYLMKQRDLILAEMDCLTGRLVADHHDAVRAGVLPLLDGVRQARPASRDRRSPRRSRRPRRRCGRSAPRRSRSRARAR